MPGLVLVTPPATEPLTLADAKAHLRVEHSADDALIGALIVAARQACEDHTGRALITQTLALWLNSVTTPAITLPRAPLQNVTAFDVYDADDNATTLDAANYLVDVTRTPGQLVLRHGAAPTPGRAVNGIKVTYVAGYGNAAAVPTVLKQGMLAHIAQLYEQRGDAAADILLPALCQQLYHAYKVFGVA